MSDPFLGEIGMFAFTFAPKSWADCDGKEMLISQNQALYSLLGTSFGGNNTTYFKLPDLRGRTPIGWGQGYDSLSYDLGTSGGLETVTLSTSELPTHTHLVNTTTESGDSFNPTSFAVTSNATAEIYGNASQLTPLVSGSVFPVGGGLAHNNMQPSLAIRFAIAMTGIYPPRS